jgi:hypothetical protein
MDSGQIGNLNAVNIARLDAPVPRWNVAEATSELAREVTLVGEAGEIRDSPKW